MTEDKFYSPLKIGLLIVVLSYFLFTLHGTFTLSWIGEWNRINGSFSFPVYVGDICGFVGLVFRLTGSTIALAAIIFYFAKKQISKISLYKIVRVILFFEAVYWFCFFGTTAFEVQSFIRELGHHSILFILNSLGTNIVPIVLESLVVPIALLFFAYKLNPNKPLKAAIKWGLISGTLIIFEFWLTNTSIWIATINQKGIGYLTSYPQNWFSFVLTAYGLLALGIYSACYAASSKADSLKELNLKVVGVIITSLGFFFLWNYLSWIFFGGNYEWSDWYAWFLGHNLDLWMLSLPLLGVPLLFTNKSPRENSSDSGAV